MNHTIYQPGRLRIPNTNLSLFDWMLREQERLHSLVRRYQSPDEYAFFPEVLELPVLPPLNYPKLLHPNDVNLNLDLKDIYIKNILPAVCAHPTRQERPEAQENYGSAATCDVLCLQALSRRIHFGKFVAEAKFRQETDRFKALINAGDKKSLCRLITDEAVEEKVLQRLELKAKTYGMDPSEKNEAPVKINVDAVVDMYRVSSSRGWIATAV